MNTHISLLGTLKNNDAPSNKYQRFYVIILNVKKNYRSLFLPCQQKKNGSVSCKVKHEKSVVIARCFHDKTGSFYVITPYKHLHYNMELFQLITVYYFSSHNLKHFVVTREVFCLNVISLYYAIK